MLPAVFGILPGSRPAILRCGTMCFVANRDALLEALDEFSHGLQQMYAAVEQGDSRAMTGIITRAKSAREYFYPNSGKSVIFEIYE